MSPPDETPMGNNVEDSLISLVRNSNPNLRPIDTPAQVRKPLTRKKPTEPEPLLRAEELKDQVEPVEAASELKDPFWKYHVLHFGEGLYLTTNPTPKHINCQSLPGYYVKHSGDLRNFTLQFEGIESGEEIISVDKRTTKGDVSFRYHLHPRRTLIQGRLVDHEEKAGVSGEVTCLRFPKEVPLLPEMQTTNFGWREGGCATWNIGSVPMAVPSKLSLKASKYLGKHNIYFHNLFSKHHSWRVGDSPEVAAMFRRCESSHRKRFVQSVHRLLAKDSKVYGTDMPLDLFAEVKTYALAGDGLRWDLHPKDDEPDHRYKLGWLTIYNDEELLAESGMFDIVVALTVAIAFDQNRNR